MLGGATFPNVAYRFLHGMHRGKRLRDLRAAMPSLLTQMRSASQDDYTNHR